MLNSSEFEKVTKNKNKVKLSKIKEKQTRTHIHIHIQQDSLSLFLRKKTKGGGGEVKKDTLEETDTVSQSVENGGKSHKHNIHVYRVRYGKCQ